MPELVAANLGFREATSSNITADTDWTLEFSIYQA
jgi:hypothetical protein